MHAVLIENPTAHNVTPGSLRVAERALAATFDLELVSTQARGHAAELAQEAAEAGAKTVIAYGGDGTLNEVVNGVLAAGPADVVVAVLPGGGTNVVARNLGYPNDLVEATGRLIESVENGDRRRLAIGRLDTSGPAGKLSRHFVFGAGVCLDADTARRVDETGLRPRWGDLAFVYCAVRAFFALRRSGSPQLVVETPDGDMEAWWATLINCDPFTYLGRRPFRVAPRASFERGLDLVAGRSIGVSLTLASVFQALRSAKHVDRKQLLYLEDRPELHLRALQPVPLQADGEYLGEIEELRATALPAAVSFWA